MSYEDGSVEGYLRAAIMLIFMIAAFCCAALGVYFFFTIQLAKAFVALVTAITVFLVGNALATAGTN